MEKDEKGSGRDLFLSVIFHHSTGHDSWPVGRNLFRELLDCERTADLLGSSVIKGNLCVGRRS
jgi:hypothetical protein